MVALFQLFGGGATRSRSNAGIPDVSAVRTSRLLACEPPELTLAKASEATPAAITAAAVALADLSVVRLNVAIAVARPAVVVRVLIAPVVLRDSGSSGGGQRLFLDASSGGLHCFAAGRGFRRSTTALCGGSPT